MLTVGFFEAHKEYKKEMDLIFKEKGYKLKEKRALLKEMFPNDVPTLSDMTISQMEQVIERLK